MPKNPKYVNYASPPPVADPNQIGGVKNQSLQSREAHSYLWTGHIIHVDIETMVCSLAIDFGAAKEWHDVPLPAPAGSGPRSWAGCIPEPGTKVLVQWKQFGNRNFQPYIVGFMTAGTFPARHYEPYSTCDPQEAREALEAVPELADDPRYNLGIIRLKARKAYSGDFIASSSSGADFLLDRNATIQNRAGNEFRLRDSDQTAVLQTINEFTSSAAGYYRRGLIRRNAFNLLPDLMLSVPDRTPGMIGDKLIDEVLSEKNVTIENSNPSEWNAVLVDQIDPSSTAFETLKNFGFVDESGKVIDTITKSQTDPIYPFVIVPDGRRQSYAVAGVQDLKYDETDECYVEDRADIFHTSNAVMSVTEEGDGIQIDNPSSRIFIEDVKGTVVGNDPFSDGGRELYKRILSIKMFDSEDPGANPRAELFPIDMTSPSEAETIALARLFRVKCPADDAKQYTFGITKEGRVFLEVPCSSGDLQSIDLATSGGVRAFLGPNSERVSLNLKTQGGVKLDIGSFKDGSSDENDSVSVDVTLHGKIKTNYIGQQGRETIVNGTDYTSVGGSHVVIAGGGSVVAVGGTAALEAEGRRVNVGTGGYVLRSQGSYDLVCLDKASEAFAMTRTITHATGSMKTVLTGLESTMMISGVHTTTVAAGAYSVTVGAGNLSLASGIGANIAAGANVTLGAGGATTSVAGGSHTTVAGGINMMIGGIACGVQAPVVKIGTTIVGCVVAGVPGPPSPHFDFVTGLPILGQPTTFIGP